MIRNLLHSHVYIKYLSTIINGSFIYYFIKVECILELLKARRVFYFLILLLQKKKFTILFHYNVNNKALIFVVDESNKILNCLTFFLKLYIFKQHMHEYNIQNKCPTRTMCGHFKTFTFYRKIVRSYNLYNLVHMIHVFKNKYTNKYYCVRNTI